MFRKFLILIAFVAQQTVWAQTTTLAPACWSDWQEVALATTAQSRVIQPQAYRAVEWQLPALTAQLESIVDIPGVQATIQLPLPDGTTGRFVLIEASVMAPELQARYPEIRCFTGWGLDDPTAQIKADLTPQGFHAMIYSKQSGTIFIDPYYHGNPRYGIVYFKKDYVSTESYECLTTAGDEIHMEELAAQPFSKKVKLKGNQADFAGDCQLRRYRLALACTGEYANFHGGTKPLVLAAMNTSVNRVNQVWEKDLALTLQLIPNNDTLIFLNSTTDPYNNGSGGTMLGQNQTTVTQRIGAANYDIGHVFSTGGGGVAGLGVVCNNGSKARGVTGSGAPIGDPFDIDYVIHEMGHQFGGNHCFNNSCGGNINNSTAMEPGSGSTIMAYAGICSPNVQNNSDDYFHAMSIQEISAYITTGTGNNCPVKTVTGNNPPTVANTPNYTIPRSTPFELTASGNDVDGNPLTYCWEQMDNQTATMPPVSTSTGGPLFRSFDPTSSPSRTFPRINDIVTNTNPQWEELPSVARTMNFRVTVRDNFPGAGCTAEDNVALTVSGSAGPFLVTAPNTNIVWFVGEQQTVTWDVANTTAAPISTAQVRIRLSTDGGFTYPILLSDNEPNDGSALVTVPNNISNTCRVRVEAIGNVFFDISNTNFRIQIPPTPTFVISVIQPNVLACAGAQATWNMNVTGLAGFNTPTNITVTGAPVGSTVAVTPNPATPTDTVTITISDLTSEMAGSYPLAIQATGGTITQNTTASLQVLPGAPTEVISVVAPADGTNGVGFLPTLKWNSASFAQIYEVEISTSPAFGASDIVATLASTDTAGISPTLLEGATVYYWRVRASNDCGEGTWSAVNAFQTGGQTCNQSFGSTDVPLNIDENGVVVIESDLNVPVGGSIADVDVQMNINHTWVGDLVARLIAPDGTTLQLFDRPGVPADDTGCDGDNLMVGFNDESVQTQANFENSCSNVPAISGTFQPIESLGLLDGKNPMGNWKLQITDAYPEVDAGVLIAWSLSLCLGVEIGTGTLLSNTPLLVPALSQRPITATNLKAQASGTADELVYTLLSLPAHGILRFEGNNLNIGDQFTQSDIDNELVRYENTADATTDAFLFDVFDEQNNAWVHATEFDIVIIQNTLVATASISQAITCNNGSTGQITVAVTSGNTPYIYSINGGESQDSNVFGGLAAGTYTVVVTDALGFTASLPAVVLDNPTAITVTSMVVLDDLTITASGGTGDLSYSVDGINFQSSNQFNNLSDAVYTVVVRDANGCTSTKQVAVSVGALLVAANQTSPVLCFGGATGAITVSVAGGVPPYQFSLDGTNYQDAVVFSGLNSGTYTVVVRDGNGMTVTAATVTLAQPTAVSVSVSTELNTISTAALGGTPPYTYSLNGAPPVTEGFFGSLANGDYTIVATDANGCTQSINTTVNVPALTIVSAVGGAPNCDGIFDLVVTATGGVPALEYSLNGGSWQSGSTFSGVSISMLPLTVRVRDAAGTVVESGNVLVTQPNPIVLSATVVGNSVTASATGGAGNLVYMLNGVSQSNGQFTNIANGTYVLTVTDANGCTKTSSVTINFTPPSLIVTTQNISCFGANDGSFTVNVAGGQPPFTFAPAAPWSNLAPGAYTVVATDALGNTASTTVAITGPAAPVLVEATAPGNSTVVCIATGGTIPYRYSLNGGPFQNAATFSNVVDGTYTVTVQDARGCTDTFEIIVISTVDPAVTWGVTVSPNPSAGLFGVTMNTVLTGPLQLEVLDASGRVLLSERHIIGVSDWQTTLDLTQQPAGMYLLRLSDGVRVGTLSLSVVR
jgi:subtilisin-like proprotein convertase family protein